MLDQPIVCPIVVGLDRALGRHGQTALIAGEAGIGKSRLVAEARAQRLGFLIVEGSCFEPDRALPFAPFVDLLQKHFAGYPAERLDGDLGREASGLRRLLSDFATPIPPRLWRRRASRRRSCSGSPRTNPYSRSSRTCTGATM